MLFDMLTKGNFSGIETRGSNTKGQPLSGGKNLALCSGEYLFSFVVHEAGGLCGYDQANANGILV